MGQATDKKLQPKPTKTKLIVALQEYELVISVCFLSIREFVRHGGRLLADEGSIYTEHEGT